MRDIQMVDLKGQYQKIKKDIDSSIQEVITQAAFINGPQVRMFAEDLEKYLSVDYVVTCGNGTDALQIALMALGLDPGDEVIVPAFTYAATAEVIGLLRLTPVMAEVDPHSFMLTADDIEKVVTPRCKAVIPVHLFGQCASMEEIMGVAKKYGLYVIEDAAQAIGTTYTFSDGRKAKAGTIGHIGCTSFFPSKNLGCFGDGGALYTNDEQLAVKAKMIANHGQSKKYHHSIIGCNSRLDTMQAAILQVKLRHLDAYTQARMRVADRYDSTLGALDWLQIPMRITDSTHVFNQYTIRLVQAEDRDRLKDHLSQKGIPSMIYYPIPLHLQQAFRTDKSKEGDFPICEDLCTRVLSIPIHTEMDESTLGYIIDGIKSFRA